MQRGFILQPSYRIEAGEPVVVLFGVLEGGGSFVIRDTRQRPHFWIRAEDVTRARSLGARPVAEDPPRHTMRGEPVARVEVGVPAQAPPLRDRLIAAGVPCFEADVRFAYRYLIDHGIRGSLEIHGPSRPGQGVDQIWENPEIRPSSFAPALAVLAFDIETDPRAHDLLSVSLVGCGVSEVLLLTPAGASCPDDATPFASERELLEGFVRRVREIDPDVLTGWNCIDFDLAVLLRVAERHDVPFAIGRGWEPARLRTAPSSRGATQALVPGRVVLDGIQMLRGAFLRFESFALDAVAREVLGQGKSITGSDRGEEILQAFRNERERFVEYNRRDSQLVLDILDRLHLVDLAVERSRLTGMPPDRVTASIASFDFLYLSELTRRGIVAPTVHADDDAGEAGTGGHVLEPRPGLYRNVMIFDFKSLYPSLIRTFQIDPLGQVLDENEAADAIRAPNGTAFRRQPGILPRILDDLFPRRERAKAAGDRAASQAIKILMNSFYGVLGTPACRFASPSLANAITGFGREVLLWSRDRIESRGHRVLYGDTDSLFVEAGTEDAGEARRLGEHLVAALNSELSAHVQRTWRVPSRLELEFEKLYLRLLLPEVRHGGAGARKRYAGLVHTDGGPQVQFVGMEAVRRDWTELAREAQQELYRRLFLEEPVDDYLRQLVAQIRDGRHDAALVYTKALRKDLDDYTATTPPHVAAARKMRRPPRHLVSYVITRDGPEPAAERTSPLDHEHYVQKQIRPVAEAVLSILGLEFDRVIGDDSQMSLF